MDSMQYHLLLLLNQALIMESIVVVVFTYVI